MAKFLYKKNTYANAGMDAKSVRLDVYVRDGKGTIYDIDYSDFRFIPIVA